MVDFFDEDTDFRDEDEEKEGDKVTFSKLPESPENAMKYIGGSFASAPLISNKKNRFLF